MKSEIVDVVGECHFQRIMALFGWITYKTSRNLDNRKIDFVCRCKHSLIEVQLKSSNLNEKEEFVWNIFGREKDQTIEFYTQIHTFLCLIGLKLTTNGNRKIDNINDSINGSFPLIALIPGDKVCERFKNRENGGLRIALEKIRNNNDRWSEYFDENRIEGILKEEIEMQKVEKEMIEKRFKKNA